MTYFDETQRFTREQRENNPDIAERRFLDYSAHRLHEIQALYRFNDSWSFYGGINNIEDNKPDVGETFFPVSAVGRFFYAGVNFEMF